jgi:hypothetical protein
MDTLLQYLPKPLLNSIVTGNCLPIVGAGLSANAVLPENKKLPLWDELGREFAEMLPDYPYTTPIDAISAYCQEYSRPTMIEELMKFLHIDLAKPGLSHLAFGKLPFDIVCTTNLDFLLEKSYGSTPNSTYCRPIIGEDQLSISRANSGVVLIKLHGDLHHPNNLIVTEEDYDTFINKYPLICTYLANLLITRTPLFIGYSLEDPDFRQIWQIIGNRLHGMRRSAFALLVGSKTADIARYQRRGVRVVNLPGIKSNYDKILSSLFEELRMNWTTKISQSGIITDESVGEVRLPEGSATRLCFFSVPSKLLSFYKYFVFPIAERYGFIPLTADSMIIPGDNIIAKITTLLDKAQLVVADVTSSWVQSEVEMAFKRESKPKILLVVPAGIEHSRFASYLKEGDVAVVGRLDEFLLSKGDVLEKELYPKFLKEIEDWFSKQAENLIAPYAEEPTRLLNKGEYRAAVISVMTQFEVKLTEITRKNKNDKRYISMLEQLNYLQKRELLQENEKLSLLEYWRIRIGLVHGKDGVSEVEAKQIVNFVLDILKRLDKA